MTDSTAASAIWGGFRAVVAVGVAAAGLTVVLGPGVARSVNRAFSLLSLRLGFMMIRPRPTAAAREAFFAKIEDNYARRKQGQPLPSPPPSHFPVEEESTHATLMPADENVFLELMAGIRVPTAHFNLPFTAADGRQTFIAIPGSYIPTYFPGTGPTGINVYSFWGLETPDAAYGPVIYLPDQPHYTPARDGQPAMLFDGHSGWTWPVVAASSARVSNWINQRNAHYVAFAPPSHITWLGQGAGVGVFPDGNDQDDADEQDEASEQDEKPLPAIEDLYDTELATEAPVPGQVLRRRG